MANNEDIARLLESMSEDLRLAHKELTWAAKHMANIYNAVKPAEKSPIEGDPNQLKIFDE